MRRFSGLVLLVTVVGCGGPEPPVLLQNLDVYQDEQEGFRFRPPPGWMMQSRTASADRAKEIGLVKYKRGSGTQVGVFQVSAIDLTPGTDVTAYVDKALGKDDKRTSKKSEALQVGGQPGARDTYNTRWDRETLTKEIVAVRRGPRVYFLTGIYPPADKETKDAIRKTLDSMEWLDERKG